MAVDVHARAEHGDRIREAATNTANEDSRMVHAIRLTQRHVGREVTDLVGCINALRLHGFGRNSDDRKRQVFEALLATSSGHDDLLENRCGSTLRRGFL